MSANTVPLDRDELQLATDEADWLLSQPGTAPVRAPQPGPDLRIVPEARSRSRRLSPLVAALTGVGVILATLFAQLGLSIAVSQGAYEARALQSELRDLTRVERVLSQNTDKLASPQNLADNAAKLGMVQNTTPATLRLSDGAVLGTLGGPTAAIASSLVPNATLEGLPVVDADGLLTERNPEQAAAAAAVAAAAAIPWEGPLPAPQTH
ncbi:MAG: hypothetical protein LCH36_09595 [Actinobacteria bacterium]|nr:hypothetical protein [Actinomycetota bacterium]